MKFVISSSLLSSRLQTTGRVIATTNSLPILESFLFEVDGEKLTITASDNETTLRTNMTVGESDAKIRFAVNAKTAVVVNFADPANGDFTQSDVKAGDPTWFK